MYKWLFYLYQCSLFDKTLFVLYFTTKADRILRDKITDFGIICKYKQLNVFYLLIYNTLFNLFILYSVPVK